MMKFFRRGQLIIATLFLGGVLCLAPAVSATSLFNGSQSQQEACQGINLSQSQNACSTNGTSSLDGIIAVVINILSIIVGVAAVIVILIAGMRFVVSGGSSQAVSGARNHLIYAIVGLIVAGMAQVIVHFVLGNIHS